MALTDPPNTLAYHQSRVLAMKRDMSNIRVKHLAKAIDAYGSGPGGQTYPEVDAIDFYGFNHLVALISQHRAPLEPLNATELNIVNTYYGDMAAKAVRALYYLVYICTREARHNSSLASSLPKMKAQFGDSCATFFDDINGGEASIWKKLISNSPDCTTGQFVECLRWQFYNSSWSPGFGGKKWGVVTDCLERFVTGVYSAEMMLDTNWTLAHNGGPIFNKGQHYHGYGSTLYRLLDVQRSGQIPEAVLADAKIQTKTSNALKSAVTDALTLYPGKIGPYVDWFAVEALGALHGYESDQQAQFEKHGASPQHAALMLAKEEKAKAKHAAQLEYAAQKELAKAEHAKNHLTIQPGVTVKVIHRNKEAA